MDANPDYYKNYVSTQLGHVHSDDYKLMSRYFRKNYTKFIRRLDEDILDVGCGMGHFLFFLREHGCKSVTGIDLSQECVDHCLKENLGTSDSLIRIGLEKFLLNRKESCDVIVLNDVIEHLPKKPLSVVSVLFGKLYAKMGVSSLKSLIRRIPSQEQPVVILILHILQVSQKRAWHKFYVWPGFQRQSFTPKTYGYSIRLLISLGSPCRVFSELFFVCYFYFTGEKQHEFLRKI